MSKRTTFTTITPLPAGITRTMALQFLHDHAEMIDLNPLVIERHTIEPPKHAQAEERDCVWYSITDKISYLPGTDLVKGNVTYTCAFHDLPRGLQTHCYAAMGLEIRDKWSVGGTEPGEAPEIQELGLGAPTSGLYIREDVDFKCNVFMAGFVKKTLKKSHGVLVEAMARKAQEQNAGINTGSLSPDQSEQRDHRPSRTPDARGEPIDDDKPFVSGGQNQGQPGQDDYGVSVRYYPPRISPGVSHDTTTRDSRSGHQQQRPVLAEMDGQNYPALPSTANNDSRR